MSIPPNSYRTVSFAPIGSLWDSNMCWPLSHASLTLEAQLVSSAADVCASPTPQHATNANLPAIPRSEQFKILLPRLCFSMITLSSVGQSEYDRILSSTGLNMSLNSYVTLQASVVDKSPRISFSRSLANIRSSGGELKIPAEL